MKENKDVMWLCIGIGLLGLFLFSGIGIYNNLSKTKVIVITNCDYWNECEMYRTTNEYQELLGGYEEGCITEMKGDLAYFNHGWINKYWLQKKH